MIGIRQSEVIDTVLSTLPADCVYCIDYEKTDAGWGVYIGHFLRGDTGIAERVWMLSLCAKEETAIKKMDEIESYIDGLANDYIEVVKS